MIKSRVWKEKMETFFAASVQIDNYKLRMASRINYIKLVLLIGLSLQLRLMECDGKTSCDDLWIITESFCARVNFYRFLQDVGGEQQCPEVFHVDRKHRRRNSGNITYNSLRNSDVVGWSSRGGLIWTSSVSQNAQLLRSFDAALTESSQLDPVGADGLISRDYEIVAFTCGRRKAKHYFSHSEKRFPQIKNTEIWFYTAISGLHNSSPLRTKSI